MCATFCADKYPLFGVEGGGLCYGTNTPGAGYALTNSSSCSYLCPGNEAENCGGDGYFNMFSVSGVSASTSSSVVSTSSSSSIGTSRSVSTTTSSSSQSLTSSSMSPTSTSTAYSYLGCYSEGTNVRALDSASTTNYTSMTHKISAAFCTPIYSAYGVEYGGECYCGNSLSVGSVVAPSTDCNMACGGNAVEI